VADLAGEPVRPAMERAIEDDAGRDPGPDRQQGERLGRPDQAAPVLGRRFR
jgi:hypothetical protein